MMRHRQLAWWIVGFLFAACCALAVLQYRWISDFSIEQQNRLKRDLENRLGLMGHALNDTFSDAAQALTPGDDEIAEQGTERAVADRVARWRQSRGPLVRRVALAISAPDGVRLRNLNFDSGEFADAPWPDEWANERRRLAWRAEHRPGPPDAPPLPQLLEVPQFGDGREPSWLLIEWNMDYLRSDVLPAMHKKFLGDDFDARVTFGSTVLYDSGIQGTAEASVRSFEAPPHSPGPGPGPARGRRGPMHPPPHEDFRRPPPPRNTGDRALQQGVDWKLEAGHRAGSLEEMVARSRWRNIAASTFLLLLIAAATLMLMRVSRQAQRLAELQVNFVAGVSHELRTPLTVIRTAAFNLRKFGDRREQVEKYGALIEQESGKLATLVEQVLQFASGEAGRLVRDRHPAAIEDVIDSAVESVRASADKHVVIEKRFDDALPPVSVDEGAMKRALQNLIENAIKYGTTLDNWIGISARAANGCVEVRIADRGVGIPAEEQARVFDAFYRGRRAIADQIHGTGLGLSLVKRIIEAHGGSVRMNSGPQGTEFIVQIPALETERQHEFANSPG